MRVCESLPRDGETSHEDRGIAPFFCERFLLRQERFCRTMDDQGTTRRKGRCATGWFETLLALYPVPQILLNPAKILGVNHQFPPSFCDRSRVVSQSGKFGEIPSTTQKCHSD